MRIRAEPHDTHGRTQACRREGTLVDGNWGQLCRLRQRYNRDVVPILDAIDVECWIERDARNLQAARSRTKVRTLVHLELDTLPNCVRIHAMCGGEHGAGGNHCSSAQ